MAFNNKYVSTFTNAEGADCVISIQGKDYSGVVKTMTMTGEPCKLVTTQTELHDPIQGLGCELSLWSELGDDYSELFLAPPNTYKVIVTIDSVIVFQGFVDNEFYSESFLAPPFELNITATDGLKGLEVYSPSEVISEPTASLISILRECLDQTALVLPIRVKCALMAEDMDIMDDSDMYTIDNQVSTLFDKAQIFTKALEEKNSKEVVEMVLKPFNCKLYQDGTVWRIDRLNDKYHASDNTTCIEYDTVLPNVVFDTSEVISIGGDPYLTDNYWVHGSQVAEVQQPYSKQEVVGSLTEDDNKIPSITAATSITSIGDYNKDAGIKPNPINEYAFYTNTFGTTTFDTVPSGYYNADLQRLSRTGGFMYTPEDDYKLSYDNGGIGFYLMGYIFATDDWHTPIMYRTPLTLTNYNYNELRPVPSDTIEISLDINTSITDLTDKVPSIVSTRYTNLTIDEDTVAVHVPIYVTVTNDANEELWLRYVDKDTHKDYKDGFDEGYVWGPYHHNYEEQYRHEVEVYLGRLSGVINSSASISITNKNTSAHLRGQYYTSQELKGLKDMTVIISAPYYKANCEADMSNGGEYTGYIQATGKDIFPSGILLDNISVTIEDITEYDNSYTGVLDERHITREAPRLDIDLWNPVRAGGDRVSRGLVSSSSSWWNRNITSNLLKYYGVFTYLSSLDATAGLGLWYDIDDLGAAGGDPTDLGNRLPTNLLASYFTTYANTQEIYIGDVSTKKPLSYRDIYSMEHSGNTKRFMLQSTDFDIRNNISTVRLFELHADSVVVNT